VNDRDGGEHGSMEFVKRIVKVEGREHRQCVERKK